ncbi:hypothetical protein cypCar_00021414 [Cyprinus carpio]|nr:hypothetical protein cypCar_00021414 [Cyprinus carpio]
MSERTPLLHYRLSASVNESGEHRRDEHEPRSPATVRGRSAARQPPKLNTFFGVVIPTLLSMFSVVVFLRIGFVVGQCGLYQTIVMLLVAYFIISMTVLSVCAISTNGALDAGGAYYMISRALGPEFGGSIGIMFFLANVCGSALYVLGLVEAILTTFGISDDGLSLTGSRYEALPTGYWWSLLYGTVILLLCVLVCLIGAHIYAKATFLIFIIVMVVLGTIFISFFAVPFRTVQLPSHRNASLSPTSANFTGFKLDTLLGNVQADYVVDYTTGVMMSFATVFAVMFNGCTGIMAGSNMSVSWEEMLFCAASGVFEGVSLLIVGDGWSDRDGEERLTRQPFLTLSGLLRTHSMEVTACFTLTRCYRCMAHLTVALNVITNPSEFISFSPYRPIIFGQLQREPIDGEDENDTILLQQDYGFLTDINVWHPFVTIGVYSSTLSAAMSNLIGASRILFALAKDNLLGRFLSPAKHTSASGNPWVSVLISWVFVQLVLFSGKLNTIASIVTIFFLLVYAAVDLACLALEWASAPNFRPTFRYFTWHTCVLGIVGCAVMMFLINAIYASASIAFMLLLLLLIHYLSPVSSWGCISQALIFHQAVCDPILWFWVSMMISRLRTSCRTPLYQSANSLTTRLKPSTQKTKTTRPFMFPQCEGGVSVGRGGVWGGKSMGPQEYVCVIADAVKMLKNVALARYFGQFDRTQALQGPLFVDVWPVNLLRPDSAAYVDTCSLFLLQLACILNMTRAWQKAKLRLFLCVEEGRSLKGTEQKLKHLLKELRMKAEISTVPWDSQVALHWQRQTRSEKIEELESEEGGVEADKVFVNSFPSNTSRVSDEYLQAVNKLILDQTLRPPAVRFLYLPRPPADTSRYHDYLNQLELLTRNLGPTLLIHGVTPVITTDL